MKSFINLNASVCHNRLSLVVKELQCEIILSPTIQFSDIRKKNIAVSVIYFHFWCYNIYSIYGWEVREPIESLIP